MNAPPRSTGSGESHVLPVRLRELQSKFEDHVILAVQGWNKHIVDETQLEGMSAYAKADARAKARAEGLDGFLLTLDSASYDAVMRGADDRALRHEMYEAYATRASDRGPRAYRFDNGPIIENILAFRHQEATRLGFPNYAEWLLQTEVGGTADDVERLLLELNAKVRGRAQAELHEVWAFAKAEHGLKGFRPWDLRYYTERLERTKHGVADVQTGESLPGTIRGQPISGGSCDVALTRLYEIEAALFDLRVHRDYVPAEKASRLRSHVLDTLAQARREVSLLPPPPWDRFASSFGVGFGNRSAPTWVMGLFLQSGHADDPVGRFNEGAGGLTNG